MGSHQPLSGAAAGFDVPTVRGLWWNAPYLHDGSATTIQAAVLAHDLLPPVSALTPVELDQVAAYVLSVDDNEAESPTYLPEPGLSVGALLGVAWLHGLARRRRVRSR